MLQNIIPKLPARNFDETAIYYQKLLNFEEWARYDEYLILGLDNWELHFYLAADLNPKTNEHMLYWRWEKELDKLAKRCYELNLSFASQGQLALKPWGQWEFSLLDPNGTLLTFGQEAGE